MIYALCFFAGLLIGPIALEVFYWWDLRPIVFDDRETQNKN